MGKKDGQPTQSCLHVENLMDGENNCFISYLPALACLWNALINYWAVAQMSEILSSKKQYGLDIYLATVAGIEGTLVFVGSHCVDVKEESERPAVGPGK